MIYLEEHSGPVQPENEEGPKAGASRGLKGDDIPRPDLSNPTDKPRQVAILRAVAHVYEVEFAGELIVHRSRDPECDLARALLARGVTGAVKILDGTTGKHRSTVNIEKAAKLRTYDDKRGLGFERWKPFQPLDVRPPAAETDLSLASTPGEREAA